MLHQNRELSYSSRKSFLSRGLSNLSKDGTFDDDESPATDTGVKLTPALLIVLPSILFFLLCICIFVMWKHHIDTKSKNINTNESLEINNQTLEEQEKSEDSLGRKRLIFEVLFPVQCHSSRKLNEDNVEYLTEKHTPEHCLTSISRLTPSHANVDMQCPICLEDVVIDPVLIHCSHCYHRSCILRWIDDGYDECFECRQPLWDSETYCYIDKLVKEKGHRRSGTSNK